MQMPHLPARQVECFSVRWKYIVPYYGTLLIFTAHCIIIAESSQSWRHHLTRAFTCAIM
jgi:hypothetical protein